MKTGSAERRSIGSGVFAPWVCVLVLGALLLVPPADAKTLLREAFGGKKPAMTSGAGQASGPAQGWRPGIVGDHKGEARYRSYPVAGTLQAESGTIELEIVRDNVQGTEALFALAAEDGTAILVAQIFWNGLTQRKFPELRFEGKRSVSVWHRDYSNPGYGKGKFYSECIPLGQEIPPGRSFHLAFTWGERLEDCEIYLNGKKIETLRTLPFGMKEIILRSSFLALGGEPLKGLKGGYSYINSSIAEFAVHDIASNVYALRQVPTISAISDDTFKIPGISGKLVAGDKVSVELKALPGGTASFDMGKVTGIAMTEVPPTGGAPGIPAVDNGTYRGSCTIKPGDDWENGQIVGNFVSSDNVAAEPVLSASKWTIDTKPVVAFNIDKKDLPADSSTKARVKLVAKDANGNPVKGRHLKLTLATTDEYTGTVGAGDFGKEVGALVETRWRGETDSWGEVEFDYTAGFAAKTVILTAKDLDSGGVTVDYLTAFKEASIDIALTPVVSRAATRRGVVYILKVEATRTELTADGRSRSVIRATLTDPNGKPVSGDPVAFTLSSANGSIRTIVGTTDANGVATAEYIAGKKIGIVVVTATATLRNVSGNVSIILLSDAPAKIYLKARPESLPADGFSRADLNVKVTDINDNPNKDTKVEFKVSKGGGRIEYPDRVTDRFGDASNRYTSGTVPGVATIMATVRSKVPTESELAKAKNVLFVPYQGDADSIRIEKWLKKRGDAFVRGEALVEYTAGRDRTIALLKAPWDGTLGEIFVEYWDNAEVGQTLAIIEPKIK